MITRTKGFTTWPLRRPAFIYALLAILMRLPAADVSSAAPVKDEAARQVLILSSYNFTSPGVAMATQAFRAAFRNNSVGRVQYYHEGVDRNRIPEANYPDDLVAYLKWKYKGEKIDLIIALGTPTMQVLATHRANFLPDTPIIFYYFDESEETAGRLAPNVTRVWSKPDYGKTLETALALQPETEKVVVVAGSSAHDKGLLAGAENELRNYEGRVEITYLTDLTMEQFQQKLAGLPAHSVVILLSVALDRAGNSFSGPEMVSLLAPAANAPTYGIARPYLGYGIVGGSLMDFEAAGTRIGELGLRLFGGERPQDIPPQTVPNALMFDERALRRWGVSEKRLPPESRVEFREPTFWERYRWYVTAGITMTLLEALLIAGLLTNRARLRQVEEESRRLARLAEDRRQKLDQVLSDVPGIVWECRFEPDGTTTMQFINSYAEKALGYRVEKWLSTPDFMWSIVHQEDRDILARQRSAILACRKERVFEFRWRAKDGRVLWAEAHITPILDVEGEAVGMRGVCIDITIRKHAEEALRQSEQRNLDILRALPDMVFLHSHDGTYLDYHAGKSSDRRVALAEFIGKNLRDVLPAELAEAILDCFRRAQITGKPQVLEYELPIKGETRWFEARIVHTDGDQFLSIVRNITERKRAAEALRQSEDHLRLTQRTARIGTWEWNLLTGEVIWSEGIYNLLGLEPGDGHTRLEEFIEFIHPEDREGSLANAAAAISAGGAYADEFRIRRRDGAILWLVAKGYVVTNASGKAEWVIGVNIDITESKRAEEALQAAFAQVSDLKAQLEAENISLKEAIRVEHNFDEIIGNSEAIKNVLYQIEQVAPTSTTVLILGETGTGKELVARALHRTSLRKDKPLVKVNCAALPATLIESELFGHERGAFTSATTRQLGRFELANGGTIFLDEIGDLPLELQVKMLRVLQEGEFERLGSGKTIKVDVRIIAATNRNLPLEIDKGVFRQDLWYRLNVFPITVPPLRERREDIPLLVEEFVQQISKKHGKTIVAIAPAAMRALEDYPWPGNIRELANMIERAVVNTDGTILRLADQFPRPAAGKFPSERQTLEELERQYILRVLKQTGWRIEGPKGAARILGLNPSTLRTRMVKLKIQKSEQVSS